MQRKDAKIANQKECIDRQAKELERRNQQEVKRTGLENRLGTTSKSVHKC